MLRLDALRTLLMVVECGTIRDAGQRLCRTPSAVSMTLKQIERELGGALFSGDRKQQLTPLGERVHATALRLLRDYDQDMARISAYANGLAGHLRLAAVPSVATHVLPRLLPAFLQARPTLRLSLVDTDSTTVRALVAAGKVDLGIGGAPPPGSTLTDDAAPTPALQFTPLFSDRFYLVCRNDHPLGSTSAPLPSVALHDQPLIANEASAAITDPALQAALAGARIHIRNVASLLASVSAGLGCTLLPALATRALPSTLCAVALEQPSLTRTVGLIERHGLTPEPVLRAFRDHLCSHALIAELQAGNAWIGDADSSPVTETGDRQT